MSGDASTLTHEQQAQADADFAAGFDDDTTAAPTETPAAQQDDTTQGENTEPAPAAPAPEYAQLTKAERDELIAAMREQMPKQFGTAFGKMGGFERWKAEQEAAAARAREIQSRLTDDKIAALREDLPDFADGLEIIRSLQVIAAGDGVDQEQIASLVAEKVSAVEQKFELRLLAKDHPDWKQIDADPAFAAWVATQPDEFKQGLAQASQAYDSAVVSEAMTKFKQARRTAPANTGGDPASARRSRMSAAVTPRGVGGPATPNATDDLMAGFND